MHGLDTGCWDHCALNCGRGFCKTQPLPSWKSWSGGRDKEVNGILQCSLPNAFIAECPGKLDWDHLWIWVWVWVCVHVCVHMNMGECTYAHVSTQGERNRKSRSSQSSWRKWNLTQFLKDDLEVTSGERRKGRPARRSNRVDEVMQIGGTWGSPASGEAARECGECNHQGSQPGRGELWAGRYHAGVEYEKGQESELHSLLSSGRQTH